MSTMTSKDHIVPLRTYFLVAGALFILTIITVAVSYIHLGGWNVVVALFVAGTKATLVALIFMHLKYDKKIYAVILVGSIMFLVLFISLTMFDTMNRGDIYEIKAEPIKKEAVIYDHMPAASEHGEHGATMADSTNTGEKSEPAGETPSEH